MRWPFQQYIGWLSALLMAICLVVCVVGFVVVTGCALPQQEDYQDPGVGLSGAAAVEKCRQDRYLPCGWVYDCGRTQWCVIWADRIGPYPVKLLETVESLYGSCSLADDARFRGTPICYYHCDGGKGCNAEDGCACLEAAP